MSNEAHSWPYFFSFHAGSGTVPKNWLATGLIYISTDKPSLSETYNLVETPLNRLQEADLRPGPEMIQKINDLMF